MKQKEDTTNCILIHYGELILKGGNRKWFEEKLFNNIRAKLRGLSVKSVENHAGRLAIDFADTYPVTTLHDKLCKVFGVAGFAPAILATTNLSDIEKTVLFCLESRQIGSFAVRAKRIDKKLPYSSQEVNERIGRAIVRSCDRAIVNLDNPETTVHIDILNDRSYIYIDKFKGAGGLPSGTSGRVACLISGGIDSPVAAWKMMKRGCSVSFIHFHSAPFTDRASIEKVKELVENLNEWQEKNGRLVIIPLGNIQKKIVTAMHEKYRVILYRRFMVRIAEEIAKELGAEALVTGEALGQVASQTLSNMATVEFVAGIPILRPLIGMDKQEIVDLAIKIGTYNLSIIQHQDCCQFLEPRHPATRTTPSEMAEVEKHLNIEELVKEGLTHAEWKDIKNSA